MIYITFPPDYIQVPRYPGYLWNFITKKLYSYKSGIIRELSRNNSGFFRGKTIPAGYRVSRNGYRHHLSEDWLLKLPFNHSVVEEEIIQLKTTITYKNS